MLHTIKAGQILFQASFIRSFPQFIRGASFGLPLEMDLKGHKGGRGNPGYP